MSPSKILFKVYYIGRKKYYGSQRQIDLMTIEQCLLNALQEKNYIQKIGNSEFEFASRTDRYVSARGACFTCVTEKKPITEILESLGEEKNIFLLGCNGCAEVCETGGETALLEMKEELEKAGKTIAGQVLIDFLCAEECLWSNSIVRIHQTQQEILGDSLAQ